ncbi:nucleotide-diphospho-sugar transferase [Obelidium mucronatum]|nr:nucleotide-diphospho-sugar transferase [Obelidium mucronatum]
MINTTSLLVHAILLCYVGTLTGLLVALAFEAPLGASVLYWLLVALNGAVAAYVLAEALAALVVRLRFPPDAAAARPFAAYAQYSATVVIAAYLPNEKDIILETVHHFLNDVDWPCPHSVVLAYNTPEALPVEHVLEKLAESSAGRFTAVKVPGSTSKAANVNYILQNLSNKLSPTHIVSVFDADHRPYKDAFMQIIQTLHDKPDTSCVQGRCIIRNASESFIARMIEPEFDMIYNIFHVGFNAIHGHGLFGGSNGHWRAPAISALLMDGTMLTEDIDLSVRALANGLHITYDHRVRSSEEAPTSLSAYVKQRSRWAQGWFQITFHRSFWAMSTTKKWSIKIGMFLFLIFRELSFHINTILTLQVIIGLCRKPSINKFIWAAVAAFLLLFIILMASVRNMLNGFIFYLLFLLYTFLQGYIVLVSEVKEFLAIAKWKVTQRTPAMKTQNSQEDIQMTYLVAE